jgi:8-oxo-dGTP diphosphatase
MQVYAGVIAQYDGKIALVRDHYEAWDQPYWNLPSGGVDVGESPAAGAVRELREETGLHTTPDALRLVWTTTVIKSGETLSQSWNYVATVTDPEFLIDDPDDTVTDAAWFSPEDAVRLLHKMPWPPITVPALAYLQTPALASWAFTLADPAHWTWQSEPLS